MVLGLIYAASTLTAEWHYAVGWHHSPTFERAVWHLNEAQRRFPLNGRFRLATSYIHVANPSSDRNVAIKEIQRSLSTNPYAADLYSNLTGIYLQQGNWVEARKNFAILKKLAPLSPIVKKAEKEF